MKVFYKGRKHRTYATGDYDPKTGKVIVHKDSVVSESVANFRGAVKIMKLRDANVDEEGRLIRDMEFNSPSTSAAFVTGYSASGFLMWHVEKHTTLREYLSSKR